MTNTKTKTNKKIINLKHVKINIKNMPLILIYSIQNFYMNILDFILLSIKKLKKWFQFNLKFFNNKL